MGIGLENTHNHTSSLTQPLLFALGLAGYPAIALYYAYTHGDSGWEGLIFRIVCIAISGIVFFFNKSSTDNLSRHPLGWLLLLLWGMLLLRLMIDIGFHPYYFDGKEDRYLFVYLGIGVIPSLGFFLPVKMTDSNKIFNYSWALLFVVCVAWLFFGFFIDPLHSFERGRFGTEQFNPISMGHLGGSLVLLSFFGIWARTGLIKICFSLGILIGGAILILAISRGPIVAVLFCIVLLVVFNLLSKNMKSLNILIWGFLIILIFYFSIQWMEDNTPLKLISRFTEESDLYDESTWTRVQIIQGAFRLFFSSPLIGAAAIEPIYHDYPHNIFLESLMAVGVIGTLILLLLLAVASFRAINVLKNNKNMGWISLLFFQYTIASMFSGSLYVSSGAQWYFLTAILALGGVKKENEFDVQPP